MKEYNGARKEYKRKIISLITLLTLLFSMVFSTPILVMAAESITPTSWNDSVNGSTGDWTLKDGDTLDLSTLKTNPDANGKTISVSGGAVTIKGDKDTTFKNISINISGGAHVKIENLNITNDTFYSSPIIAEDNNPNNQLIISGINEIVSNGINYPGIEVDGTTALSITNLDNTDRLNATGGDNSSGIGGRDLCRGGTITINGSGNVTATGGTGASGIGGGGSANGGNITINGSGNVTAKGGEMGSGIGGGYFGSGGNITINDSVNVTATGGDYGSGIGGGLSGSGGTITIVNTPNIIAFGKNSVTGAINGTITATSLPIISGKLSEPLSNTSDTNIKLTDIANTSNTKDLHFPSGAYSFLTTVESSGEYIVDADDKSLVESSSTPTQGIYNLTSYQEYNMTTGYKVTFDSQGGTPNFKYGFAKSGIKVSAPSTEPTKNGRIFEGWYKEPSCINKWDFNTDVGNANIILYANYQLATGMIVSTAVKTPAESGKVMLTATPGASDTSHKVYYRVVDIDPSAMYVGDVITTSDWTEVTDTTKVNEISVENGKYIEVVEVTADNKVTKWGKSNVINDGYTPSYEIGLSQTGTFMFADQTESYSSVAPKSVTITKTGNEDITNLHAVLSGANLNDFNLVGLSAETLDNTNPLATFTINPKDGLKAGSYNATVIVTADNGVSESIEVRFKVTSSSGGDIVTPPSNTDTTPASVTIKGIESVGNTLMAEFLDKDKNVVTTDAAVIYEWYRLDASNSSFTKEIGTSKTYDLTNDDLGKYIGLSATYAGKSFIGVSGIIQGSTSNNNSASSSKHRRHHDSTKTTDEQKDKTTKGDSDSKTETTEGDSASKTEPTGADQKEGTTDKYETKKTDGWIDILGKWQYLINGQPVTGWKQIDGKWYLFDSMGTMQIGWKEVNGVWYLLKDNGAMATGWQNVNSKWYFMKDSGAMAKGWQEVNGIWYFLKDDGEMAIGWQDTDGQWYYLYSDGAMAKNTSVDGYNVGDDGAWIQ